jgi:hypothetical protein
MFAGRISMNEYDLLAVWFRVADWAAYDLSKSGEEGIVLKPLGQYPKAATFIARAASKSSVWRHRKIAACLAGWIKKPPQDDLLRDLLQQEAERDRQLPKKDFGRLDTQSVVEDIVFSAAFWARNPDTREAGFDLLRSVVERTIGGEYWNTSSYAITTLLHHQASGSSELLKRFHDFAVNARVDHPSKPSLTQEKEFAQNLMAKNPKTLNVIESLLDQKVESAAGEGLDENGRATIEGLVQFAEQFDAASEITGTQL